MGAAKRYNPNVAGSKANSFSTGKRIYNGVSNSPHSGGGLNPSGYINRDRKANVRRNALINMAKRYRGK